MKKPYIYEGKLLIREGKIAISEAFSLECCCYNCDHFPDCLVCDETDPVELGITFTGAPSGNVECDPVDCGETSCSPSFETMTWNALNGFFILENIPGTSAFIIEFEPDCDDANIIGGQALLIHEGRFERCISDLCEGAEARLYIRRIIVTLSCDPDNGVYINTITFDYCYCCRLKTSGGSYGDWECSIGQFNENEGCFAFCLTNVNITSPICDYRKEVLEYAVPCKLTGQDSDMSNLMTWANTIAVGEGACFFDCNTDDPCTNEVTVSAGLGCGGA